MPISIIVGDMDNLKEVNDNYGHQTGDKFIKKAGEIFNDFVREANIVARVGGDEFSIILPETDLTTVKKICNRIRNECQKCNQRNVLSNSRFDV